MDYEKIRTKETQFVTLTTLSTQEFDYLLPDFEQILKRQYKKTSRGTVRLNKFQWRTELPSAGHHLFFLLTYLKENPTQEFQGAVFNISQELVSTVIKDCLKAFNAVLQKKKLLPCQNGEDFKAFISHLKERFADNRFVTTQDILMDATEMEVQRPKDEGEQEDNYSGKKQYHTVKKLILSLFCGSIVLASYQEAGRVADKKMADLQQITFPKNTYLWTDLGFIGYQNEDIQLVIPHKTPKNGELTDEQKKDNQIIASYRIRNEHAIGGMKRCRIMKDSIRLHDAQKRDMVFSSCAGLHNLRIVMRNIA